MHHVPAAMVLYTVPMEMVMLWSSGSALLHPMFRDGMLAPAINFFQRAAAFHVRTNHVGADNQWRQWSRPCLVWEKV
jgi:hypothetical protein